jgi:hypothetical protein
MYDNSFVNDNSQDKFEKKEEGGQKSEYIQKEIDRIRRALHRRRMARQASQGEEFEGEEQKEETF